MTPILAAALILGGIGIVGLVAQLTFEVWTRKKNARESKKFMSFLGRKDALEAEIKARRDEAESYSDKIVSAFKKAKEMNALIVSEVSWSDIESDKYSRVVHKDALLTRFSPCLPKKLAERIREAEVRMERHGDYEGISAICLAARRIKWRVEEVPRRFEPAGIKESDRIVYPDISSTILGVPTILKIAARKMLDYDDEYLMMAAKEDEESDGEVDFSDEDLDLSSDNE